MMTQIMKPLNQIKTKLTKLCHLKYKFSLMNNITHLRMQLKINPPTLSHQVVNMKIGHTVHL